jgi:hypothetical protein
MATPPTVRKAAAPATLSCPECGKTFTRAAALGAHRKMTHGVAGSSANATANRKRTTSRRRTATTRSQSPRTPSTNNTRPPTVDRDALLRTLFPNGIPPRQEIIGQVNDWLDQAERLARSR